MTFADWGLPTAECITSIRAAQPEVPLIASGDCVMDWMCKAIALGADIGLAWPLQAAAEAALHALVEVLIAEITTVLFCTATLPYLNYGILEPCSD